MGAMRNSAVMATVTAVFMTLSAWATPPNTPNLDGVPNEYDSTDLVGSFSGSPAWHDLNSENFRYRGIEPSASVLTPYTCPDTL